MCQVLIIVWGAVDLHRGFEVLEWDIHQWQTTQSRGARERAIRAQVGRHHRKSPHSLCLVSSLILIQEFGIDIVREDNKTIIPHSRRPRRMRLLRTIRLHHSPRRAAPAPTPDTTTSAPTAPPHPPRARRARPIHHPPHLRRGAPPHTNGAAASFSFAQGGVWGSNAGGWRPLMPSQGLGGMGSVGSANVHPYPSFLPPVRAPPKPKTEAKTSPNPNPHRTPPPPQQQQR